LKSPFLKNYLLVIAIVIGIDYLIASILAGSKRDDVWFWFGVLIFVPIIFAIKSSLVRLACWYVLLRGEMIRDIFDSFRENSFPKPNWDYSIGSDYLQDVMNSEDMPLSTRLLAARMYSEHQTLTASQQFVGAFMANSALKSAIKKYEVHLA
jgi:hypothetical protein